MEAAAPDNYDAIESAPIVPTSEPGFVRALKASKMGSKPNHKKGDVLRVISKKSQRDLNGE